MKSTIKSILFTIIIATFFSCNKSNKDKPSQTAEFQKKELPTIEQVAFNSKNTNDFVPKGFEVSEKTTGDLNKDGIADCVLIINGTEKSRIIKDETRGELDQNRRGIIILLNQNGGYELAIKNQDCFSSEYEDGGIYFAPELVVEIKNGNLIINYLHGRYGFWAYTFRFQNNDFELIGYDNSENRGPIVLSETSINFLTKKRIVKTNTNQETDEPEEEVFEETTTKIKNTKLFKLTEIKNFDEFNTLE
jgi:hypothetical protein